MFISAGGAGSAQQVSGFELLKTQDPYRQRLLGPQYLKQSYIPRSLKVSPYEGVFYIAFLIFSYFYVVARLPIEQAYQANR